MTTETTEDDSRLTRDNTDDALAKWRCIHLLIFKVFTDIADFIIFTYAPDDVLIKRRIARDRWAKIFQSESAFVEYLRTKSLPSYHAKLLPLANEARVILDTSTGTLYKKI